MLLLSALSVLAIQTPREYLTEVVSPVYETPGSAAELARRGETCLSQTIRPADGGEIIVSRDAENGMVVANNAFEYRDSFVMWKVRSRLTFEGREGRFRLTHSAIERFNEQSLGASVLRGSPWGQIGKWRGSGWQKAQTAFEGVSAQVAQCVMSARSTSNW